MKPRISALTVAVAAHLATLFFVPSGVPRREAGLIDWGGAGEMLAALAIVLVLAVAYRLLERRFATSVTLGVGDVSLLIVGYVVATWVVGYTRWGPHEPFIRQGEYVLQSREESREQVISRDSYVTAKNVKWRFFTAIFMFLTAARAHEKEQSSSRVGSPARGAEAAPAKAPPRGRRRRRR